jgi:hypothetical protein
MSRPAAPHPAKLVIGFFMPGKDPGQQVTSALVERFGPLDLVSAWFPFDYTAYYEQEMGRPLFRRMLAFERLIEQDQLAAIKQATNALENQWARDGRRQVNIDPGYLLRERFVLATAKNYTHRIYIGQGIYADLTLIYSHGRFATLPWTYPDYRAANMQAFLMRVRKRYVAVSKHPHWQVQRQDLHSGQGSGDKDP